MPEHCDTGFRKYCCVSEFGTCDGLTLPLVSKGGTSMLITCMAFGMILSVSRFIEQSVGDVGKVEIKPLDEDHH
jgi:hypothetical protein